MSSVPTLPAAEPLPHQPSLVAAILSYLVPGLGQIMQGRYGKGFLFMISLLGMFFLGQAMGQWQNVYVPPSGPEGFRHQERGRGNLMNSLIVRWHYAGQFWIGVAAWPALWQYFDMPLPATEPAPDASEFDKKARAFVRQYQKFPRETEVNALLVNSDKTPDLGWVYTVIAGMLNILVIYDAYAGAAFPPLTRPVPKNQLAAVGQAKKEEAL